MGDKEPVQVLLAHDRWATDQAKDMTMPVLEYGRPEPRRAKRFLAAIEGVLLTLFAGAIGIALSIVLSMALEVAGWRPEGYGVAYIVLPVQVLLLVYYGASRTRRWSMLAPFILGTAGLIWLLITARTMMAGPF